MSPIARNSRPVPTRRVTVLALLLCALVLAACISLAPDYSLESYKNATSLKAETMAMVGKAHEPYRNHADKAEALLTRIDAAHEFADGPPRNQISAQQWSLIRDPEQPLYGGFLAFWREHGTVGEYFRDQYRAQIAEAFDFIICLESYKKEATDCAKGGQQ